MSESVGGWTEAQKLKLLYVGVKPEKDAALIYRKV